jgi:hypothetical protein
VHLQFLSTPFGLTHSSFHVTFLQTRYKFQSEIQQMMFVFGEVSDPLPETTMLVEDIVRSQVIEIVSTWFQARNSLQGLIQWALVLKY